MGFGRVFGWFGGFLGVVMRVFGAAKVISAAMTVGHKRVNRSTNTHSHITHLWSQPMWTTPPSGRLRRENPVRFRIRWTILWPCVVGAWGADRRYRVIVASGLIGIR